MSAALWAATLASSPALGADGATHRAVLVERLDEGAPRTYVGLRAGAGTFNVLHPEICVEGAPLRFLSVEACGTGSGFLHRDPAPAISHFRTRIHPFAFEADVAWIQPLVGIGFAELQVGADGSGFDFRGTGGTGVETAGPELGAGVRMVIPAVGGLEWIGELNVSGAWFPHAPKLTRPMRRFQPSASFTIGLGF